MKYLDAVPNKALNVSYNRIHHVLLISPLFKVITNSEITLWNFDEVFHKLVRKLIPEKPGFCLPWYLHHTHSLPAFQVPHKDTEKIMKILELFLVCPLYYHGRWISPLNLFPLKFFEELIIPELSIHGSYLSLV